MCSKVLASSLESTFPGLEKAIRVMSFFFTTTILTCPKDHNVIFPTFAASDEADTLDAIFRGEKEIEDSEFGFGGRKWPSDYEQPK